MAYKSKRRGMMRLVAPFALLVGAYACGASDEGAGGGAAGGSTCGVNDDCQSAGCVDGRCATAGGDACTSNPDCASGSCVDGTCTAVVGAGGTNSGGSSGNDGGDFGTPCTTNTECASGVCESGACTAPSTGGTSTGGTSTGVGGTSTGGTAGFGGGGAGMAGTPGAQYPGSGNGYRPLIPGCGPETADQCTGECEQSGGVPSTVVRPPATLCFIGDGDLTPDDPSVVIEQVIEIINGVEYVHIRITFDPAFTDNTYGTGACCGWGANRGHTFRDLTSSDHSQLLLTDASGATVMDFKIDLATADATAECGNGTLGVTGGDGSVIVGDAADVVAVATSLDRNLNGCDYCTNAACGPTGDCTVDSPTTDANYTPNPLTPDWDYRQVYEVWILASAFGDAGFGQAYVTYVHSSPAKTTDTLTLTPTPCPPEWDEPYCPPGVIAEGGNCFGTPGGTGGTTGTDGGTPTGGTGGSGGTGTSCPPNFQVYITSEGASICTPIPFANYPDRAPCPAGYVLDIASEGQFCLPA